MHRTLMDQYCTGCYWPILFFFLNPFPYLRSVLQGFILEVLQSCASSLCTPVYMSFFLNMPHLHLVFRCPITSMFSSSSGCFSTCPNHLSIAPLMFSLMFAKPDLALICFCHDLLNPLYSHHPSQHSHVCSL